MINLPEKCLRNSKDCEPLAQIESDEEPKCFICCGLISEERRKPKHDKFALCWHTERVDECGAWAERDLIDTVSIIMQALSVEANMRNNEEINK